MTKKLPPRIDFAAPARLLKWPSLANQRQGDREPYVVLVATLDECIRELMIKPEATRHLYEIRTMPQGLVVPELLVLDHVLELSRFRAFL
jgi:hypothetical protein